MAVDSADHLPVPIVVDVGRRLPGDTAPGLKRPARPQSGSTAWRIRPTWPAVVAWLPLPFMVVGSAFFLLGALPDGWFAVDAHIYYRGAAAWLAGTDPWQASYQAGIATYHFSALPWALPFIAPFTLVPESVGTAAMVILSVLAAAVILRRSGLPARWLIFPPLVSGMLNGNPIVICTALILFNCPIGVLVRPQMIWALVGEARWRAILAAGAIAVLLSAFVPIGTFLGDLNTISRDYGFESGGGSSGGTVLILVVGIAAVLVLAVRSRRTAGWLATIAVWPLNSWYGGIAALPVLTPLLAIGFSVLAIGVPIWTIALFAVAQVSIPRLPAGQTILEPFVRPYALPPGNAPRRVSLRGIAVPTWPLAAPLPTDAKV